jgi:hypothetical protein
MVIGVIWNSFLREKEKEMPDSKLTPKISIVLTEAEALMIADCVNFTLASLSGNISTVMEATKSLQEGMRIWFNVETLHNMNNLINKISEWGERINTK